MSNAPNTSAALLLKFSLPAILKGSKVLLQLDSWATTTTPLFLVDRVGAGACVTTGDRCPIDGRYRPIDEN